jgi:hypothetical protein
MKKHPDFKPLKVNKQLLMIMDETGRVLGSEKWREAPLDPIRLMQEELVSE